MCNGNVGSRSMRKFICAVTCMAALVSLVTAQTIVSNQPGFMERHPRYLLQPEDVLFISFPLSPELNQTVTVQPDGYITLQGVGALQVEGMTVPDLVTGLQKAYNPILRDAIISVDLQEFHRPFFTVTGQVGKPGRFELRDDTTVSEAIAIAGGMTSPSARTQIFLFRRVNADWFEVKKVNLRAVLAGKNIGEDIHIRPGDMVFVPEKFIAQFRKYVPYSAAAVGYVNSY